MAVENGFHVNGDAGHTEGEHTTTSPYTTRAISVRIGPNGSKYPVFEAMIDRYPGLKARLDLKLAEPRINLPEVDDDIAHTLIHFIYTQDYQNLGLGGIPENVRAKAEFKRSVLTYCAARLCGIESLEALTKSKMEHFSQQISVFDVHDVVGEISTKIPAQELWFPEHLYRWIKRMLQADDRLVTDERLLGIVGQTVLFNKALFRSISEMYSEKASALQYLSSKSLSLDVNGHMESNEKPVEEPINEPAPHDLPLRTTAAAEPREPEDGAVNGEAPELARNGSSTPKVEATAEPVVDGPDSVTETGSIKSMALESSTKADSVMMPDNEAETPSQSPLVVSLKEEEVPKTDIAGKATDSDVEAARAKASKKSKKKKNKSKAANEA